MSIAIVADSTCDLPDDIIEELGINIIPLTINIDNKAWLDKVDITRKQFYSNLPDYASHPTSSTPGIGVFLEKFKELAEKGYSEIISIHVSESLSATVNVARTAAEQFLSVPVHVIDSLQLSLGTGFQVELAARMAEAGKTVDEIAEALADLARRTFVTAKLASLEYLRRSGRMSRIMSGIGSLLQLKPILTMKDGNPGSEKVRTNQKAETRLVEMLKEHLPIERFALLHTNAEAGAEEFRKRISRYLPDEVFWSLDITPVIGSHIGPGAVGFALVTKPNQD